MPSLSSAARAFRQAILTADSAAAARITRAYTTAYRRINLELEAVTARIARARIDGESVTPDLLYREGRLQRLRELVLAEVTRFSRDADTVIQAAVLDAQGLGRQGAAALAADVLPPGYTATSLFGTSLSTEAVTAAIGNFRSQAIQGILTGLPAGAAQGVEDAIVSGIIEGRNPREVARRVRTHLAGDLNRALTVSRTEMMRAHREGSITEYRAHADVLRGWQWVAGLGSRTCASCWAQHGTIHPLDEQMASHPRCRCVAVPLTKSWSELGFPGMQEPDPIEDGASLFARAPADVQRSVLGPSGYDAYRSGRVGLQDFVHRDVDPLWGPSSRAAGVAEARTNAQARRAA